MSKIKTKVQHFYTLEGEYIKTLKYYTNGVCDKCGKDILRVRRYGMCHVLSADRLYLLKEGNGLDSVYNKQGIRYWGQLVDNPNPCGEYIAGYVLHECS